MATVVLLPGLHGTADLFGPLRAEIPADVRVRVVEYPADRCLGYEALFRRLEGELREEEEMILVAESFSGGLAVKLAAAHPGRVRGVVVCASFVTSPVPRFLTWLAVVPILLRVPMPAIAIRIFLSGSRAPRELVRATRAAVRRNRALVLAHRVLVAGAIDVRKELAQCRVPILALAGRRDRLVGRRSVRRIRRVRGDVEVELFDAPHLLLQTRPREVWEAVERFIGAPDARAKAACTAWWV